MYEAGDMLSEAERAELERWWREQFDRSFDEHFSFCADGKIFTGDIARELHWIWADLPPVLHEKWMAERRRRVAACRYAM